jgi:hypothetical protein
MANVKTGVDVFAAGGGSALVNWTEAVSIAAPNATIPATSWTPSNAAANVDAVLRPKGTGSVLAQVPDNLTTGGNKRGTNAVDLSTIRYVADRVASGQNSVIGGGITNQATGGTSVVGGGSGNKAQGIDSTVSGGSSNEAAAGMAGIANTIAGGRSNNTQAGYTSIGGGESNRTLLGSEYACIPGGYFVETHYKGELGLAHGRFAANGDAQTSFVTMRRESTIGGAAVILTLDGQAEVAGVGGNTINILDNNVKAFNIRVAARDTGLVNNFAWFDFSGCIKRDVGAATTALVGAVTTVASGNTGGGSATWTCVVAANVGGRLTITVVTPAASGTGPCRWVATCGFTKVA